MPGLPTPVIPPGDDLDGDAAAPMAAAAAAELSESVALASARFAARFAASSCWLASRSSERSRLAASCAVAWLACKGCVRREESVRRESQRQDECECEEQAMVR